MCKFFTFHAGGTGGHGRQGPIDIAVLVDGSGIGVRGSCIACDIDTTETDVLCNWLAAQRCELLAYDIYGTWSGSDT